MAELAKKLERWGRRHLAESLCRRLLVGSKPPGGLPDPPKRILVCRTDVRIGNTVLMEPLLRSLSERFPDSHTTVLMSRRFSAILSSQGYEVLSVDKKGMARFPWRFIGFARNLRNLGADVAIDASHVDCFSLSSAAVAAMSGAGWLVGAETEGSGRWFTNRVRAHEEGMHESRMLHALGSVWPGWPEWRRPRLSPPSEAGGGSCDIGLHVGGRREKRYPESKLADLVSQLSRRYSVGLYWGSEREKALARRLAAEGAEVMPKMSITEMMASLAGLRLLVSPDTGPMHLASALGVPVLALFRVPNVSRYAPLSPGSRALLDPEGPDPGKAASAAAEILG